MESKLIVQFSEKDLLCKAGCGFYGTPQCQGLCSKCWRNHQRQQHWQTAAVNAGAQESNASAAASGTFNKTWSGLGFDKFLEKKNQQSNRRTGTLRSFLRKSPSTDNATLTNADAGSAAASTTRQTQHKRLVKRQLSEESQSAKDNFLCFLYKLPKPVAHDVSKEVSQIIEKIIRLSEQRAPIDELSELVQDMYQTISDLIRRNPAMKDSEFNMQQILEEVERYVCTRCYNLLFCPNTDEEVEDLSLQDRIRSLHWVTCGFLETALDFTSSVVKDRIDAAVTEINDINSAEATINSPSRRAPQRKLDAILQCSKLIFEALKESSGAAASADEYLPALIYVILRSNPPQLKSNTTFISRFALPIKLMSGEAGYYYTNLCCALKYVQNLNADSLTMPREEFEAYTSGQLFPPLNESNFRCNQAVKSLENSLDELRKLNERKDVLFDRIDAFDRKENEEWDKFFQAVLTFRDQNPPCKSLDAVWLESSPDKEQLLPPPLKPMPVAGSSTEQVENEDLNELTNHDSTHVAKTASTETTI